MLMRSPRGAQSLRIGALIRRTWERWETRFGDALVAGMLLRLLRPEPAFRTSGAKVHSCCLWASISAAASAFWLRAREFCTSSFSVVAYTPRSRHPQLCRSSQQTGSMWNSNDSMGDATQHDAFADLLIGFRPQLSCQLLWDGTHGGAGALDRTRPPNLHCTLRSCST